MSGRGYDPANPFGWLASETPTPEDANRMTEDARRANLELAALFYDVLGTGRGPELMEHLRDCTIEVGLLDQQRSAVRGDLALTPEQWFCIREGQNSIVRMMEDQIRIALTPVEQPAQQEGEDNA